MKEGRWEALFSTSLAVPHSHRVTLQVHTQVPPGGPALPFRPSGQGSCFHESLMPVQLGWFPSPLQMLFSLTKLINTPHATSEPSVSCLTRRDVSLWSGRHVHTSGESQRWHLHIWPHHSFLQGLCLGIWLSSGRWLPQGHGGGGAGQSGSYSSGITLAQVHWPLSVFPPCFLFCPPPLPSSVFTKAAPRSSMPHLLVLIPALKLLLRPQGSGPCCQLVMTCQTQQALCAGR